MTAEMGKSEQGKDIIDVESEGKEGMKGFFVCFLLKETRKSSRV